MSKVWSECFKCPKLYLPAPSPHTEACIDIWLPCYQVSAAEIRLSHYQLLLGHFTRSEHTQMHPFPQVTGAVNHGESEHLHQNKAATVTPETLPVQLLVFKNPCGRGEKLTGFSCEGATLKLTLNAA